MRKWEEMYDSYKAMSKALGVKKPQEAQKVRGRSVLKVSAQALEERCVPQRLMMASEVWGEADLGGRLALLGCDGHCVFAHSVNGVE